MSNDQFMRRALELAAQKVKEGRGGPFAALVVRDGNVVAEGWNDVTFANDPTAHAEVNAIRKACTALATFQLSDCDLITTCEPCPMCLGASYWARLRRIYYAHTRAEAAAIGFDDDFIYREIALDPAARSIPATRLTVERAAAPFEEWTKAANKKMY